MKRLIDCTLKQSVPDCLTGLTPHIDFLWGGLNNPWQIETGPCFDNADFTLDHHTQTIIINDNGMRLRTRPQKPCVFSLAQICIVLEALRAAAMIETHDNIYSQTHPTLWPLIARVARADRIAVITHAVWAAAQQDPDNHTALWRAWLCGPYAPIAQIYGLMARTCPEMDNDRRMAEIVRRFFTHSDYIRAADRDALTRMEQNCDAFNMRGNVVVSAQTIQLMTPAPNKPISYLGDLADDILCDKVAASMAHPFDVAHMRHILAEAGATHIGALAIRDTRLAARLGQTFSLPV